MSFLAVFTGPRQLTASSMAASSSGPAPVSPNTLARGAPNGFQAKLVAHEGFLHVDFDALC
eukprot:5622654-Alexandrium_andersonii.AAC.1